MAAPLRIAGVAPWRGLVVVAASGLAVPFGAILGYVIRLPRPRPLPFVLALAGGILIYVTSNEVIPESHSHGHEGTASSAVLGFLLTGPRGSASLIPAYGEPANTSLVFRFCLSFAMLALFASACGETDRTSLRHEPGLPDGRHAGLRPFPTWRLLQRLRRTPLPVGGGCIRIFPYESPGPACVSQTCESDQICPSNASPNPNAPTSFCEPRATERRYCEKTCGSDGDCRSGYVCRQAGIEGVTTGPTNYGSLAFVANATPTTIVKFCSPSP